MRGPSEVRCAVDAQEQDVLHLLYPPRECEEGCAPFAHCNQDALTSLTFPTFETNVNLFLERDADVLCLYAVGTGAFETLLLVVGDLLMEGQNWDKPQDWI